MLNNAYTRRTSSVKIPHGVETHITETLNDESFATPSGSGANHAHVAGFVNEVLQPVEDTSASSGNSSMDASLVDGLARDASV